MNVVGISTAQLRGTLVAASLSGALSAGLVVVNDYVISIAAIDGGHRLTITRGSEVQTMDVMNGERGPQGEQGPQGESGVDVTLASKDAAGIIRVGENLKIDESGVLSVDTANAVEQDNTRPVTAAAVYTEVGNINALLETI